MLQGIGSWQLGDAGGNQAAGRLIAGGLATWCPGAAAQESGRQQCRVRGCMHAAGRGGLHGAVACGLLQATVEQRRAGQGTCKISYKALLVDWLHQCTVAARNKRGGADEGCMQHAGRWWGATAPMRDRWTRVHISNTGCMFRDARKQGGGGAPGPQKGAGGCSQEILVFKSAPSKPRSCRRPLGTSTAVAGPKRCTAGSLLTNKSSCRVGRQPTCKAMRP